MNRRNIEWSEVEPHLPSFWLNVLKEAQRNPKWSRAMIFSAMLADASFCTMHHADVMQPPDEGQCEGELCDLGLFMIINGETGVGKTPVHKILHQVIEDHCASQEALYAGAVRNFIVKMKIWDLEGKGLAKAIVRAVQKGEPDDELRDEMIKHENDKPREPVEDRMLIQAMSSSAFMDVADGQHKRLFVSHHDARKVMKKGGMMDDLDAFCTGWDYDGTYMLDTAYKQKQFSELLIAMLLMIQPDKFCEFIERSNGAARDSGFIARCLITTVRKDQEHDLMDGEARDGESLRNFLARMAQLLDFAAERRAVGEYGRITLTFSPEAVGNWKKHREWVALQTQSDGGYANIDDFIAKYMTNLSRIAGIFHYFDKHEGEISQATLVAAIAAMQFYASEFQTIFDPINSHPKSITDAWRIVKYLYNQYWINGSWKAFHQVSYNDVLQARIVREGVRDFDAAIDHLVLKGYLEIDKSKRKKFMRLKHTEFRRLSADSFDNPMPSYFCNRGGWIDREPIPSLMPPLFPIGGSYTLNASSSE